MKLLCVVYGIGRGVKTAAPSINKNIIRPLRKLDIDLEIIYVVNKLSHIDNKRSGDLGELPPLPQNIFEGEQRFYFKKDELLNQDLLNKAKKVKDGHNDNFKSYENLLCQLGMLKQASILKDFTLYDRILMIRDDLLVDGSKINMETLIQISDHGPITTMWHWHGGVGERFVICKPKIAVKLANRIDSVLSFIKKYNYLNGEHLQKYLLENENETVFAFNLKLKRVRLNFIVKENFYIPIWRPFELFRVIFAVCRYNYRSFYYTFLSDANLRSEK